MPDFYDYYWQPPPPVYDPAEAKDLLAEAGFPTGSTPASYTATSSYANIGEAMVDNLATIGIRIKLLPIERAAFVKGLRGKQYKNIIQAGPGAFGNAATRMETLVVKGGIFAYGTYPDIDEIYQQQAVELDKEKRAAILHKIQQLIYERTIFAPIWQLAFLNGVGPRVGEIQLRPDRGLPLHGALRGHHDKICLILYVKPLAAVEPRRQDVG